MAALKYWVWLGTLPGVGSRTKLRLLEHFSSPEALYYADREELLLTAAVDKVQAQCFENRSLDRAEAVLAECARLGQFIVTLEDTTYPARLRDIFDPPLLLYGKGSMPIFDDEVAIAVVGTRSCTAYGIDVAAQLGYELSKQGALLLSGMAKGIDTAAMQGALRAGGFTAGLLGGGVDVIYPAENRRLFEDVAATGVLLSEYPPGTEPKARHFPQRNRILSGLSLATVVVEAPERSGALITAGTALEQGREVFAVPGAINAPGSRGCNALIRDGAGLVTEAWDILSLYEPRFPHKLRRLRAPLPELPRGAGETPPKAAAPAAPAAKKTASALPTLDVRRDHGGLTDDQLALLRVLPTDEAMLADDAAAKTDIPIRRVLSALTMLEIDGHIRRQGAGSFLRTVELKEE